MIIACILQIVFNFAFIFGMLVIEYPMLKINLDKMMKKGYTVIKDIDSTQKGGNLM